MLMSNRYRCTKALLPFTMPWLHQTTMGGREWFGSTPPSSVQL
ncbi:hypothetical protein X011_08035 [Mycobacterium tuberculosis variant microti OV254]|nr:hypothetical protein X011_08035 [Mycobacterium tuberculosis variant microti OV254]